MSKLLALAVLTAGLTSPAAIAQVSVYGSGAAAECYQAVKKGFPNERASIRICDKAIQHSTLKPSNRAATFVNRGILKMRIGKHEESLSDYDRALRINDDLAEAHVNKGAALIYERRYQEALTVLDRSIELNPDDLAAAHYNRAIAHESTGDITSAYYDFKKALELNEEFELAARQLDRFEVQKVQ